MRIYNTLTRRKEDIGPISPGRISMYSCGPTVYRYAHIGNLRSYLMADWLRRVLEASGYSVHHVKNITDVGHMREGLLEHEEDKVIAAARAEGKSSAEIAAFYTEAFREDEAKLNILPASEFPRATDHVPAMLRLIEALVERGHSYEVGGNVYFDIGSFPAYGKLSGQAPDDLQEGDRAASDPLKRDPRDFALWKAAEPGRALTWDSPWGKGFPGWHIECSAIVSEALGDEIDVHTGGVDNIFPHHEDEIAQSESFFGHPHVRTWVHGQHLLVDGLKMAKSTGNVYLVADLERRGFDPLAFRYLCATAHFRTRLNFTQASLRAAQRGLDRLRAALHAPDGTVTKNAEAECKELRAAFWDSARDGVNIPAALAIAWKAARSDLPGQLRRELLMDFDRLLGLDLAAPRPGEPVPAEVHARVRERQGLRDTRRYTDADALRQQVLGTGYEMRDSRDGTVVMRLAAWKADEGNIASSDDVRSLLDERPDLDFTVAVVARRGCEELQRCVSAARRWLGDAGEVIVVDNGFPEECVPVVGALAEAVQELRFFRTDHFLGSAAGRNVALKQARGRYVVMIDTSVEITGDIYSAIRSLLEDETIGVVGRWGVVTEDMREFTEATGSGPVDAVEGYLMAFRREVLREAGLLDEKYRFYRHLDLDFSYAVRSRGYRAVISTTLPVTKHEHVEWTTTPPDERERLSKRNFYRFLRKWGDREEFAVVRR
ncbi:MAG TPA: cysteine--tRNA ligase [Dehalococcoidia bacterium]|nr:cysteine--tRNA ligase [Dehalococcoidia bacterium]